MDFPSSLPIKSIGATASEYNRYAEAWQTAADLYEGGSVLKDKVVRRGQYLLKKPKEQEEVYATRQLRFSYTNLLGNIIGWYGAALFKTPAQIVKKRDGAEGDAALKVPADVETFCAAFEKDADRAGTSYVDFWRKAFESLVLHKAAYVLLDLPGHDDDAPAARSLADQRASGELDPFLVLYTPSQVINWETDRYGNLEWCIIAVSTEEREAFQNPVTMDYWYYFDREQVACYSAERNDKRTDDDVANLVDGYPRRHAMTDLQRIPVRKIEVPEGLWLANRVALPLLNHLNLDNAYDFALFQSALAQLVITGNYDDSATLSEVSYLKLNTGDTATYLEPEGRAYEAIDKRLGSLEERIYKACYLMDQARSNKATPAAQSGLSKQQDKTPSRDALSGFGDVIRPAMQLVYADVLAIRGLAEILPDVRGFDFQDKAGVEEMDFMEKSTVLDVQSDTYRRERDKKFVRVVLPDMNPETLAKIDGEIEANPTPEGAAALLAEQQQADQLNKFSQSFKGTAGIGA
jgi:hypothetical protein